MWASWQALMKHGDENKTMWKVEVGSLKSQGCLVGLERLTAPLLSEWEMDPGLAC